MARKRTKKLSPALASLVTPQNASDEQLLMKECCGIARKDNWAENFQLRYQNTGNPLSVWDCYLFARRNKEPVPDFVFEYLDQVAEKLLKTDNDLKSVGWCLEFDLGRKDKGGRSAFTQYADYLKRRETVFAVHKELSANPKLSIESACELVADKFQYKKKVKSDTIKKWYVTIKL